MTILTSLKVLLTGDTTQFEESMAGAASRLGSIGAGLTEMGGKLTANVTAPLLAAGVAAFAFATDFNSGMANVASLGAEAQAQIAEWTPLVQDVAIATGRGTADMTEGLYNVVSAFGVADDSMLVLEANARAAAAGLSTTTEAINLTSAVTKGYGDTSAEAVQYAADLALKTVQLGQTTFPELAASIGAVTPLTASLGVSQAELFAVMATGTGVTGGASEVSTQLRGVLQSLMAPTDGMTKLMEEMGFANGEAMLAGLGLQGTIEAMVGAAEATGTPLQNYIGSIEGQTLAMALAGPQADTFTEKLAAMGNVAGTVDAAFAAQTQGVNAAGFQWAQLKTEMQVLATNVGQQLIPVFASLMTFFQPLLGYVAQGVAWFAALDTRTQGIILGVVGLVVALGPMLVILGTLISSVGTVVGAIGALSGAIGAAGVALGIATVPMWAVIAVIGVIAAAVALLYFAWTNNWGGIQEKTAEAWAYVQAIFAQLSAWVTGTLIPTLQALYEKWVTEVWPTIQTVTKNVWTAVEAIFTEIGRWITENIVPWIVFLAEKWGEKWGEIQAKASEAWAVIEPVFTTVKSWLENKIQAALTSFGAKWAEVMDSLAGPLATAQMVWDTFVGAVQGFWDWISGKTFSFDISLPDLPEWAIPGSPLPIHTAWKNFAEEMARVEIAPSMDFSGANAAMLAPLPGMASEAIQGTGAAVNNRSEVNNSRAFTYNNYGNAAADPRDWFAQQTRLAAVLG